MFFFVGTGFYIFRNPTSVDWLEEFIMEPFTGSAAPKSPFVKTLTAENFEAVRTSTGQLWARRWTARLPPAI